MARRKSRHKQTQRSQECWYSYSLQSLPPGKFIEVTRRILLNPKLLVTSRVFSQLTAAGPNQ